MFGRNQKGQNKAIHSKDKSKSILKNEAITKELLEANEKEIELAQKFNSGRMPLENFHSELMVIEADRIKKALEYHLVKEGKY